MTRVDGSSARSRSRSRGGIVFEFRHDDSGALIEYDVEVDGDRVADVPDAEAEAVLRLTTAEDSGYLVAEVVVR